MQLRLVMAPPSAKEAASNAEDEAKKVEKEGISVNFGKRLAHTDRLVRDRGFKTLKKWLQKNPELKRLEFLKLWKGLYFAMWMADGRPVQQELAVNTALLLKDVPREKQAMWLDTFWETMQAAWEKLDVHRISKFLLFVRIVFAEAFQAVRLAGWQHEEMLSLGRIFTRSMPMHAKEGTNAPSLGLLLQFTRIFWEELRPQLEKGSTPKKAILSLLEPFCILAEGNGIDSLVRHIHEYIFRRAPHELLSSLVPRILDGAARPNTVKKNRQALYDTADALEKKMRTPLPEGVKPLKLLEGAVEGTSVLKSLPPLELPASSEPVVARTSKKRKKKSKTGGDSGVSPLMLPQAALPVAESEKSTGMVTTKRKKKKSTGALGSKESEAVPDVRPRKKRKRQ